MAAAAVVAGEDKWGARGFKVKWASLQEANWQTRKACPAKAGGQICFPAVRDKLCLLANLPPACAGQALQTYRTTTTSPEYCSATPSARSTSIT